jgi:hypothetical protein
MITTRRTPTPPYTESVPNRLPVAALTCAIVLLLGMALAGAQSRDPLGDDPPQAPADQTAVPSPSSQAEFRIREGTQIVDRMGYFRSAGDRLTFFSADGKQRLVALENLNLERIGRRIADQPDPLLWSITGTVTEYRGTNYLLVRMAVLRSRQPPPGEPF